MTELIMIFGAVIQITIVLIVSILVIGATYIAVILIYSLIKEASHEKNRKW